MKISRPGLFGIMGFRLIILPHIVMLTYSPQLFGVLEAEGNPFMSINSRRSPKQKVWGVWSLGKPFVPCHLRYVQLTGFWNNNVYNENDVRTNAYRYLFQN